MPKGRVISQSPDSGTGQKGDVISLVVSKGPVLVEVPDVVRMGLADAAGPLEAAGFQVEVRHSSVYIGVQYVVATDPAAAPWRPRAARSSSPSSESGQAAGVGGSHRSPLRNGSNGRQ